MFQMAQVSLQGGHETRIDLIMDPELLASVNDYWCDCWIMTMTNARKQMMHNLIIQAARKMSPEPRSMTIISTTQDLRLAPSFRNFPIMRIEPINIVGHM